MKAINLLALLALSGFVLAALSSDQALGLLGGKKGYLNEGESAKLLLSTPLEVEGERYWVAYFHQTAAPETRNLYAAVSDNTGLVEQDAGKLAKVFEAIQKITLLDSLKAGKASLEDTDLFLTESERLRQASEEVFFRNVRQQLELKYAEISFREIEARLQEVKGGQERLRDSIREARSLKSQFDIYGTALDFENYFTAYNNTFSEFNKLAGVVDKYQASVLAKAEEVTNSPSLNFSDKQEIKQVLEKLYDVGDYKGFKASVVDPATRAVALQLQRSPTLVNNSVESTLFRIAKKNAEHAYSPDVKKEVGELLAREREPLLRACAIDSSELRRAWGDVRNVMENPVNASRAAYESIPEKISSVETLARQLNEKLDACEGAPKPTPQPRQDNTLQNALLALLVLALIYYGYTRYKKWREESE